MADSLKCLHCGYEYTLPADPKQEVRERICPRCKSNSVHKLPSKK